MQSLAGSRGKVQVSLHGDSCVYIIILLLLLYILLLFEICNTKLTPHPITSSVVARFRSSHRLSLRAIVSAGALASRLRRVVYATHSTPRTHATAGRVTTWRTFLLLRAPIGCTLVKRHRPGISSAIQATDYDKVTLYNLYLDWRKWPRGMQFRRRSEPLHKEIVDRALDGSPIIQLLCLLFHGASAAKVSAPGCQHKDVAHLAAQGGRADRRIQSCLQQAHDSHSARRVNTLRRCEAVVEHGAKGWVLFPRGRLHVLAPTDAVAVPLA